MTVPFVVRMAAREVRASWRRLLFFFACVAIGVAAIVALRSIVQSVRGALVGEARTLLGADVVIATNRPWDPNVRQEIERRLRQERILARTETIETVTMARPEVETRPAARMVELLAVQPKFPLYGAVTLEPGAYRYELVRERGVLVRPELLAQLDMRVGQRIMLGGHPFTIRGVVTREPGSGPGAFSFGPRAIVALDDLRETGLLAFGSRARYELLLRMASEADAHRLASELRQSYRGRFVSVRSLRATEQDIAEDLARAEDYLSLVGFIVVVLGGVGVWSVTRVFLQQRLRSVAILKCLGATSSQVLSTYLLQSALLGLTGSLLGVALAWLALRAVPARVVTALGGHGVGLTWPAVLQGLAVGTLVSLLFALVPLMDVRRIRPLLLLREGLSEHRRTRFDPWKLAASAALLVALGAIAVWQSGSPAAGLTVLGGLLALAGLLTLAGMGIVRAAAPLATSRQFAVRHAVLSLRRPGNQTRVILMAVGLGAFFVLGVRLVQTGLLDAIQLQISEDSPDMFLIDIQADQRESLTRTVVSAGAQAPKLVPVLRARVTGVRGQLVNLESYQEVRGRGSLGREYVITYRDTLEPNEKLLEGTLDPPDRSDLPYVSIEKSHRDRFQIRVGDVMRFDVMGRIVEARVGSVREVDWGRARSGGFMFVFQPRAFAGAPVSYIGFMKGPEEVAARARVQREVAAALPNVSLIDARDIFERMEAIVANVSLGVTIVGLVALLAGVLILAGAVAMTRFQRVYEAAIFRTLGATTRTLAGMLAFEYGLLGVLAGIIGAAGALALAWGVSRRLLDIPWIVAPGTTVAGIALTGVLVLVVGVAASLEVLRQKPLGTLRSE
ncbi:MAG TPA: FtsX-like permease family protein [Vicinamibacterales bacterium]|nr:FtsX-like permease family protein [Vicinamibacterales bacterium]